MTMSPDMRAGDEDRDRTASLLREAFAEGRLTTEEFNDRLEKAHASRTFGELAQLTTDLPALPPSTTPVPTPLPATREKHNWRAAWGSWLGVAILMNVIWGASWIASPDSSHYYWPIWVYGPWGAVMLIGWISGRDRPERS